MSLSKSEPQSKPAVLGFDMGPVLAFLHCRTPDAWIAEAIQHLDILLIDHATNELKAAQSAMTLMAKHPVRSELLHKMSRLAREELVHFEQVMKILRRRGIKYQTLKAGRYAAKMASHIRKEQRQQLIDSLIVGAIIEARSCERFYSLLPHLDAELSKFYSSLLKSESRHFEDYLTLAKAYSDEDIEPICHAFLNREKSLIEGEDKLLRFHSGVPIVDAYPTRQ